MAQRLRMRLAILAVLVTTSLQGGTYDLLEISWKGLQSEPIVIDIGDKVGLTCTALRHPLWGFSTNGNFGVEYVRDRFCLMKNFSAKDVGNYQCEVNVRGKLIWGSVSLCASASKDGPRKCRDEESAPRQLVKFGLLNNDHTSDERSGLRFARRLENNQISRVVIAANESFKLRCDVETKAKTEFVWFINRRLELEEMGEYKRSSRIPTEIVATDEAEYECIARTSAHTYINHVFQVQINNEFPRKPFIDEGYMENQTKLADANVTFHCGMYVNSSMYVTWVKSNDHLGYDDEYIFHREIVQYQNASNPMTLTLNNLTRDDEGWYSCFVVDRTRSRFRSRYLKIKGDDVETSDEDEPDSNEGLSTVAWCFICMVIIVAVGGICYAAKTRWFRRTRASDRYHLIKRIEISWQSPDDDDETDEEFRPMPEVRITRVAASENDYVNCFHGYDSDYLVPRDNPWELSRKGLQLGKVLGQGAFGRVMQARLTDSKSGTCSIVAVKMLKDKHADEEVVNLISELEIMKVIGKHPNIVNLIGSCTQGGPLYVVIEYAKHGNLRDFLRARSPRFNDVQKTEQPVSLTLKHLISFAHQIALGMAHLTSKRCIHRDLAARNVLVNEDYVMKIADFGLARNICGNDYYRKETHGRLPIKWMALEALLLNEYTAKSDVWSYGILLWELMTFGGSPYPSVPSPENLYELLKSGYRMEPPDHCPSKIYALMERCWMKHPSDRPTFFEIVQILSRLTSSKLDDKDFAHLNIELVDTPPSSIEY